MAILARKKKSNRAYAASVQMSVTFPSAERRAAVQQLITDKAEIEGLNKGAVASGILERSLLPLNGTEKEVFLSALPSPMDTETKYPENLGIWRALEEAFSNALNEFSLASIDYVDCYLRLATRLSWKRNTLIHEPIALSDPRVNLMRDLEDIAPTNHSLIAELEKNTPAAYPFFSYVGENWSSLKKKKSSLSFLVYLCASCENEADRAEDRQELMEACASVQAIKAQRNNDLLRKFERSTDKEMVSIEMANGMSLTVPGDWIVLVREDPCARNYAGAIEARNTNKAPHVAFFSSCPIGSMSESEEGEVLSEAFSVAPLLGKIKNNEPTLEYGPDGGIVNLREYNDSPRIGIFPILGSDMFSDSNPAPYGAMIIKSRKGERVAG